MLRSCLSTGSDGFVAYVKSDIEPFVSQFYSMDSTGASREIHKAAGSLLNILRDETTLSKERRLHLAIRTDLAQQRSKQDGEQTAFTFSPTITTQAPMTPPDTPHMKLHRERKMGSKVDSTPMASTSSPIPQNGGLPTPINSPAHNQCQLGSVTPQLSAKGVP